MNSKIKTIFFDMDGVISDWEKAFYKQFPETDLNDFAQMSEQQKIPYNKVMKSDKTFFANLPPIEHSLKVMHNLHKAGFDVGILSSVGQDGNQNVIDGKKDWLNYYVDANIKALLVSGSKEKAHYAASDVLLIDDRDKSLTPFADEGGEVLKFDQFQTDLVKELKQFHIEMRSAPRNKIR